MDVISAIDKGDPQEVGTGYWCILPITGTGTYI